MKKQDPKEFKLTAQGSLGILALGSVGIRKWREVVKQSKLSKAAKKQEK